MNKIAIVSVAVLVSFAVILGSVAQGNTARAAELDEALLRKSDRKI